MKEVALVKETRGGVVECVHAGHICGLSDKGLMYSAGDPGIPVFLRSAGKPVQALPVLMSGAAERFGLTRREMAVMIGSHRAEPEHVEALESLMGKLGVTEEALVCKPAYPLGPAAFEEVLRNGGGKRSIYHNCSGKHLGLIACCLMKGYPVQGYWEPDHPVQREIAQLLETLSGADAGEVKLGIDGCGLPVAALPLSGAARIYLRLACPDLIEDRKLRAACAEAAALMAEHPLMIAGTDRICTELLADANIVAKGGAKGIYCFALKRERLAFAIKVTDGSEDEWPLIVAAILEQIGYADREAAQRMRRIAPAVILNDNGVAAGRNETAFRLKLAANTEEAAADCKREAGV